MEVPKESKPWLNISTIGFIGFFFQNCSYIKHFLGLLALGGTTRAPGHGRYSKPQKTVYTTFSTSVPVYQRQHRVCQLDHLSSQSETAVKLNLKAGISLTHDPEPGKDVFLQRTVSVFQIMFQIMHYSSESGSHWLHIAL